MNKIDMSKFEIAPEKYEFQYNNSEANNAKYFFLKIQDITEFIRSQLEKNNTIQIEILSNNELIFVQHFGYFNENMLIIDGKNSEGEQIISLIPHTNIQINYRIIEKENNKTEFLGFIV